MRLHSTVIATVTATLAVAITILSAPNSALAQSLSEVANDPSLATDVATESNANIVLQRRSNGVFNHQDKPKFDFFPTIKKHRPRRGAPVPPSLTLAENKAFSHRDEQLLDKSFGPSSSNNDWRSRFAGDMMDDDQLETLFPEEGTSSSMLNKQKGAYESLVEFSEKQSTNSILSEETPKCCKKGKHQEGQCKNIVTPASGVINNDLEIISLIGAGSETEVVNAPQEKKPMQCCPGKSDAERKKCCGSKKNPKPQPYGTATEAAAAAAVAAAAAEAAARASPLAVEGESSVAAAIKLVSICSTEGTRDIAACSMLYACSVYGTGDPRTSGDCKVDYLLDAACRYDIDTIKTYHSNALDASTGVCGLNIDHTYFKLPFSTIQTQNYLNAACESMYMEECAACPNLNSNTTISQCDVHGVYMSLCQQMPDMNGCTAISTFSDLCSSPQISQQPNLIVDQCKGKGPIKPHDWDPSTAFLNGELLVSKSKSPVKAPLPIMRMFFHTGEMDYVLFENFVPRTHGQYFGAIFFTFMLGIFLGFVESYRKYRVKQQRIQLQAYMLENKGERCSGTTCGEVSEEQGGFFGTLFGGKRGKVPRFWLYQFEKGLLRGIELVLAYFLMLIGMTFNVGLFITVIVSIALGVVLFDNSEDPSGDGEATGCC